MTPAEEKLIAKSIEVMESLGGLDIYASNAVKAHHTLEGEWGEAVRAVMAERAGV